MSASITVSSLALAADGKTLTGTLSGGTGTGYGPATGITGLTVTDSNTYVYLQSSTSISGTTLTIVLSSVVPAGVTIRLSVSTGSNLTDSGANTAQGQTNSAVTNNSALATTNYNFINDASKFEFAGAFASTSDTGSSAIREATGIGFADAGGGGNEYSVEFEVNITAGAGVVELQHWFITALSYSVDGAGKANLSLTNNRQFTPLASGLSVGKHLIRFNGGGVCNGVRVMNGTVTSVARTKALVLNNQAGLTLPSVTSPVTIWGAKKAVTGGYASDAYAGTILEFQFSGTDVDLATVAINGTDGYGVSIDAGIYGHLIASGDSSNNNTNAYVRLTPASVAPGTHTIKAITLNGTPAIRGIRILNGSRLEAAASAGDTTITVSDGTRFGSGDWIALGTYSKREVRQVTGISTNVLTLSAGLTNAHAQYQAVTSWCHPAGSITTYSSVDLSGHRLVAVGDSNTQGANNYGETGTPDANGNYYALYDVRLSPLNVAAASLSYNPVNLGVAGRDSIQSNSAKSDTVAYGGTATADVIAIWLGTNDINGSTTSNATFTSNIQSIITAALPGLKADGKIVLLPVGTPQTTGSTGINRAGVLADLQSLAAISGNKAVVAAGLLNGVDLTVYDASTNPNGGTDGILHYMPTSQVRLANNLVPVIAAVGYAVQQSASSGSIGVPVTLTFTRAGGSTWSTGDSISASDGAGGGAFGSFSFIAGQTTATMTYTPASVGTKTLTFTNGQGWVDAGSASYDSLPNIICSPSTIERLSTGNAIALSFASANWTPGTPGSPIFVLTGGTGASITTQTVTDATHVTLTISAGSADATLTITDPDTGATALLTVSDTTAPAVPATPTKTLTSITVSIGVPDDIDTDHYIWERDTGSGYTSFSGSTNTITDTVPAGSTYLYKVAAVDLAGNQSAYSSPLSVRGNAGGGAGAHVEYIGMGIG